MEACAWCMPPAFAVAAPALCASSANGRGASCSIRLSLGMRRSSGRTGVVESTDAPVSSSCAKSRVEIQVGPPTSASLAIESASLSRAERAHSRLSWTERLARNARPETSGRVTIRLFGVPEHVATSLGLVTA